MHYAMPARARVDFRSLASSALRFSPGFTRIARCRCWHSTCGVFGYAHLKVDSRRQGYCRARGMSYAKEEHSENVIVNKLAANYDDTHQQERTDRVNCFTTCAECLRINQFAAWDAGPGRASDRLTGGPEIVPRTLTAFLPALADYHHPLTRILLNHCSKRTTHRKTKQL